MDIIEARTYIVELLGLYGYAPRDADLTDFASELFPVRFKVGTAYHEVTATAWKENQHVGTVRVVQTHQLTEAGNRLRELMKA